MPTPPLLIQDRDPLPEVGRRRRPSFAASLAVGLLCLVIVLLAICAYLATYTWNTAPSEWSWVTATVITFALVLGILIVSAAWRHFRRPPEL